MQPRSGGKWSPQKEVHELQEVVRVKTQAVSGKEPEFSRPDPDSPFHNPLGELQSRLITIKFDQSFLRAKIKAAEDELQAAETAEAAEAKAAAKAGAALTTAQQEAVKRIQSAPLSPEEIARCEVMVEQALSTNPDVRQLEAMIHNKEMEIEDIKGVSRLREGSALSKRIAADRHLPERYR